AQNSWTTLQRDLDSVASAYGVNWSWRNPTYAPFESAGTIYERLTGTYQLDRSRSDDASRISSQALRQLSAAERSRIENRLEPPEEIAIERVTGQVPLAWSRAARITFSGD